MQIATCQWKQPNIHVALSYLNTEKNRKAKTLLKQVDANRALRLLKIAKPMIIARAK